MNERNQPSKTSISNAYTPEETGAFWDNHSLADHWDETHEVEFEVRAQHRRRITLDPEIYQQIETQAHVRGIRPETLVNLWLKEHLQKQEKA